MFQIHGTGESIADSFIRGVSAFLFFSAVLASWMVITIIYLTPNSPLVALKQSAQIIPIAEYINGHQVFFWILWASPALWAPIYAILLLTKKRIPRFHWSLINYAVVVILSVLYFITAPSA